jgi:cell division septation protein DedD
VKTAAEECGVEQQERRGSSRKGLELLTYIDMPGGNGGIVTDISEGGLGFHVVSPLGSLGLVHFLLSGSSNRIAGAGNVVWTDERGKSGGLEFTELPAEIRAQIRDWPFRTNLRLQLSNGERPDFEGISAPEGAAAEGSRHEADFSGLPLPEDRLGKRSRLLKTIGISSLAGMVGVLSYFYYRDSWKWPGELKTGGSSEQSANSPTPGADSNPSSEIALLQNAAEKSDVGSETLPGAPQAAVNEAPDPRRTSQTGQHQEASGLHKPPAADQSVQFFVQVAAVTQEADAYKVMDALQQKNFAAFIIQAVNDGFYRVQLGPYETQEAARASLRALEQAGYKPFIRR